MTSSTSNNDASAKLQYIDAGANLLDSMYQGTYHSKPRHDPDLDIVLRRAYDHGVHTIISLAGTVKESEELIELIGGLNDDDDDESTENTERVQVFGTVGVHPTRCAEVFATKKETDAEGEGGDSAEITSWIPKTEAEQNEIIQQLIRMTKDGKESGNVVAIGECGLDYARLQFCPKDIQHSGLRAQLRVAAETNLPLYLHNRESGDDLYEILSEYKDKLPSTDDGSIRGIVHSFDETIEIANKFISLGLYIGINGCSLKTPENLSTVKEIPLQNLILETDCPWCDIRPSHAGSQYVQTTFPTKKDKQYTREMGLKEGFCVKNRTEPCHVSQVAEVVAGVKGLDVEEVVTVCCQNVYDLFGSLEKKKR
eukprot:CAMPEP_0183707572 /NCGR_PEP_ID=MMETSP0737-20130205/4116_1 /TAXON_ID=385413 /ORGANISM="Thalassiosira miniscula, Strain CCMP1093" /LENGTH=367 /DNA_ID=CAMNT_0025935277 /DNA_START=248 /DNA_END=1351 /DNA_ORIENTATION=+